MAQMNLGQSFLQGFQFGDTLADRFAQKGVEREFNAFRTEIDDFIQAPLASETQAQAQAQGQAVPTSSTPGADPIPLPTTMDLLGAQEKLEKILQNARDPDWEANARKIWQDKLAGGQNKYLSQAMIAAKTGDTAATISNMNRAMALNPNGAQMRVSANEDGSFTLSGYDERTGERIEDDVVTEDDVYEYIKMLQDPEKGAALVSASLKAAIERFDKTTEQALDQDTHNLNVTKADETARHNRATERNAADANILGFAKSQATTASDTTAADVKLRGDIQRQLQRALEMTANEFDYYENYGAGMTDIIVGLVKRNIPISEANQRVIHMIKQVHADPNGPEAKQYEKLLEQMRAPRPVQTPAATEAVPTGE